MNYKYVKRPLIIEAFQLTEETRNSNENWPDWMHQAWNKPSDVEGSLSPSRKGDSSGPLIIRTLEGDMRVEFEDWIIQGIAGEIYPCKPDIFQKTYTPFKDD